MPVEFGARFHTPTLDRQHSKRKCRDGRGIKIPNDYRRGRKNRRR